MKVGMQIKAIHQKMCVVEVPVDTPRQIEGRRHHPESASVGIAGMILKPAPRPAARQHLWSSV